MFTTLATLLAITLPSHAADWRDPALPAGPGAPLQRARLVLSDLPEVGEASVLAVAGGHVVRMQQTYQGLPVIGASVATRVAGDGRVPLVRDGLRRGLALDTTPGFGLDAARALAGLPSTAAVRGELAVLPQGSGHLVWSLVAPDLQGGQLYLVDAHSGRLLARRPLAMHALGRVYAENPDSTPDTSDLELAGLDTDAGLTGFDDGFRVVQYDSGDPFFGSLEVIAELGPSEGEDYLYDPPSDTTDGTDAFAQVSTYYHLAQARRFFEALGVDFSPASFELVAIANLQSSGSALDNAFFSPQGLSGALGAPNMIGIGQGSSVDFAADADVFVHEFGHYVSSNVVGANQGQFHMNDYGLSPWVGGIDEGVADYFAASIFDDPVMGEYALSAFGAERDLSADHGRCPEDVIGEVHEDGKLIGGLAWAVREAYGAEVADPLVLGALSMLGADDSLGDFATALRELASELQAAGEIDSLEALDAAIAERGLDDCGVMQDLSDGAVTQTMWGLDLVGAYFGASCSAVTELADLHSFFHVSVPTSEEATGLRFDVELDPESSGELSWRLYLRQGEPVTMAVGYFTPEVDEYDIASDTFDDTSGTVTVEDEDFTPGQTWYGVVVHDNCPNTVLTIAAEQLGVEAAGDSGEGSLPESGGEKSGGCNASALSASGMGLLGLLALWGRRREG